MKLQQWIFIEKLLSKYKRKETAISKCKTLEHVAAVNKHFDRKGQCSELSVKQFCDNIIIAKLDTIAAAMPSTGYSMGDSVRVKFSKLVGGSDRRNYYSNSCRFRETHGYISAMLTPDEYINMSVVGGLATYIAPNQRARVKKCWWFAGEGEKNRFSLVRESGYIYNGFHATTKEEAKAGGDRLLYISKLSKTRKKKRYSFSDSLEAGNCQVGTIAFARKFGLDVNKKYTGAELLKISGEQYISYIYRMINFKN